MSQNLLSIITLSSPLVFVLAAIASWFQRGFKPKALILICKLSTILSIFIALFVAVKVYQYKLIQSITIGIANIGFSIRLDSVSIIMLTMISLLGFIIVKYSVNYLDGDNRQGAFMGRLAATIAAVQLLVISGNLGILLISWVLTSISLHRLLLFYNERPGAQLAAKKKFILARLGDACLLIAIVLLYKQFGSGNLEVIFTAIKNNTQTSLKLELATFFLALSAILKSAQFPTHGWLIEIMETPTPVSALLHAGLLNAGPYLLIRLSFIMESSTYSSVFLIIVGGFTALFASVAYLTQTSIKTALGYSSVGHMGFSLMTCGLGVYAAALLHLVAHSFYKAHAFLSSGSVIDLVRASKVIKIKKVIGPIAIVLGFLMAFLLYSAVAWVLGINIKEDGALLLVGTVIILGLSNLFSNAIASKWNISLLFRAIVLALLVSFAFFSLEAGTHKLIATQIPHLTLPQTGKMIAIIFILVSFAVAIFVQLSAAQISQKPIYRALAIHIRNGFYANAYFDKLVGALQIQPTKKKQHQKILGFKKQNSNLQKEVLVG